MTTSNTRHAYEVEVLIGTVYRTTIWAENLEAAMKRAEEMNPEAIGVEEVEADRTGVISGGFGLTSFGFGVNNVRARS